MKRFVTALSLGVMALIAHAAPPVHIVIPEDGFSDYLARDGAIAAVPVGTLMRISFDYSEYDALHPYLVAHQYCGDNQFLQWARRRIRRSVTLIWFVCEARRSPLKLLPRLVIKVS